MNKKKKAVFCIILSLILAVNLAACASSGKGTGDSQSLNSNTGRTSSKTTAKNVSGSKSASSFSIKTTDGQTLEAKPGYTAISHTGTATPESSHNTSLIFPYLGDYVAGISEVGTEKAKTGGAYSTVYYFDKAPDIDSVKKYIGSLSSYSCTLEKTWGESSKDPVYYLNCSKKVTHGGVSYGTKNYDLQITVYASKTPYFVEIVYPSEIGFDYSSLGSSSSSDTTTVKTDCSYSDGKYYFHITGYCDKDNKITVLFDPKTYTVGSSISYSDFKKQKDAGKSSLCDLIVHGKKGYLDISDTKDITVKVLEISETAVAISLKIIYMDGSNQRLVQAVAVTDGNPDETVNSDNSAVAPIVSPGTGSNVCSACGGSGRVICHVCGGDGQSLCPNCNGTGSYSLGGSLVRCTRCGGKGSVKCSSSRCVGGMTSCTACGGDGIR